MDDTVSCGRVPQALKNGSGQTSSGKRSEQSKNFTDADNGKKERAASAIILFGALLCTLWLCSFSVSEAVSAASVKGTWILPQYEAVEVFGKLGSDAPLISENAYSDDGWTIGGYFREFFSALIGK